MKQYDEGLFGDYRGLTFIWDYAGFIQAAAFRGNEQQQHCSMAVLLFHGFCLAIMLIKKIPFQATPRQIGVMIVVGILGFGMTATLVTAAYNYIPVGLATMFQFSYPLFVLIIMVILTKEKIGALRAVAVAFLAVGLVLMMDFSGGANYTGIALALLSGVTYAFYVVSNQRSCFRMLDGFTTMFYAMVASSIFLPCRAWSADN